MKRAPRSPQMDRLTVDFMARHGLLCACKVVTGKQLLFYGIAGAAWIGLLLYRWDLFVFLLTVFFALLYGFSAFFRVYNLHNITDVTFKCFADFQKHCKRNHFIFI